MNLVTLTGMKRHGKDTLAGFLIEYFASVGLTFERASLADPIKDLVAAELGVSREALEVAKRTDPAIRKRLQDVGQEARDQDPDYWINALLSRLDNDRNYIITDARYPNELETLGDYGPRVLIYRPGIDDGDGHPSEAYARQLVKSYEALPDERHFFTVEPFDFAVENSGGLRQLYDTVGDWLAEHLLVYLEGFRHGQNSVAWQEDTRVTLAETVHVGEGLRGAMATDPGLAPSAAPRL